MMNDHYLLLFLLPAFIILYKYINAMEKFRVLYQEKQKPNFPFTKESVAEQIDKNFIGYIRKMPLLPLLWVGTIFQSVVDVQLKEAQRRVRRYIYYFFLYFIFLALFMLLLQSF